MTKQNYREDEYQRTLAEAGAGELHVFGYGSLVWKPGFARVRTMKATALGYHRRLAIYSTVYRGTPKKPGLVFGLEPGGCCKGVVHTVAAGDKAKVLRYLFAREMFADAYDAVFLRARTAPDTGKPRTLRAVSFVARRGRRTYAPKMPAAAAARIIAAASGRGGGNLEYITQTRARLRKMGANSPQLDKLCRALGAA